MPRKPKETHLRVRIGPALLARLERAREKSGRTMTGEIVARIELGFERQDVAELAERVARLAANIAVEQALGRLRPPVLLADIGESSESGDKS
jgi:hypothetical protein